MKTDQWIELLASDLAVVDSKAHEKRLRWTVSLGAALATAAAVFAWGWRSFEAADFATPMLWGRWLFCVSVIAVGCLAVTRLARPGQSVKGLAGTVALPFGLLWLLALGQLASSDPTDRLSLVLGSTAVQCPGNIAMVSIPVWFGSLWVLRQMAPTRPLWAGAAAGLLAGGVGAFGYTFHCSELEAPFLAVWYVLGIALLSGAGAIAGRWVLRW